MDRLSPLDAMFLGWAVVTFLGLWAIWPPIAVTAAGAAGLAATVGLFLGMRNKPEPE